MSARNVVNPLNPNLIENPPVLQSNVEAILQSVASDMFLVECTKIQLKWSVWLYTGKSQSVIVFTV